MNEHRALRLAQQAITILGLNLTDLTVLTEAATGYYALTPLIAALAGARRVLALTRDSRFGKATEVREATDALARRWNVEDRVEVMLAREDDRIGQADIVTNLGFVRPLDASMLRRLKPTAVIPLMWETWEYRPEDLDLAECRRLGIPVLGTDERHPDLRIFDYVGHLALKLLLQLDIELLKSDVVVVGGGQFPPFVVASLQAAGARVTRVRTGEGESLASREAREALAGCDAAVIVEHHSRELLIGQGGQISAWELHDLNPGVSLAHISGWVERKDVMDAGIPCQPDRLAPPGYMSVATDYLGPKSLIELHTAGLKVGEVLARARLRGLGREEAEAAACACCPLCQAMRE